MEDPLDQSLRVIASLNAHGVDYVVIGGVAMNLHGLVRATEDLDLFLRAEPTNIERLRAALREVWDDPEIEQITAEDLCGDYPAVRYGPPEGTLFLDLLTRLGTFATFDAIESMVCTIEGTEVKVATPAALIWLKEGTVRPLDHSDAAALRRAFDLYDRKEER